MSPIKVLLVAENPSAPLPGDGIEVLVARNSVEARELLLAHDISLALLEVEHDGFDLAEWMRGDERTKHVTIFRSTIDLFLELAHARRLSQVFGHDLRSPLASITTGLELLNLQLQDERHRETLERMASAGRRMADLIEEMLERTRGRLGSRIAAMTEAKRVGPHR